IWHSVAGSMAADAHDAAELGRFELYSSDDRGRLYSCGGPRRVLFERTGQRGPLDGCAPDIRRYFVGCGHIAENGVARMKWLLLAVILVATVLVDLLQSYEMKRSGEQSVGARGIARLLRVIASRKFLLLGIACMA